VLALQALRDGQQQTIPAEELVPGDIVLIKSGDKVPADLRLISATNLQVCALPAPLHVASVRKYRCLRLQLHYSGCCWYSSVFLHQQLHSLCVNAENVSRVVSAGSGRLCVVPCCIMLCHAVPCCA
jgi:hypothetical protein